MSDHSDDENDEEDGSEDEDEEDDEGDEEEGEEEEGDEDEDEPEVRCQSYDASRLCPSLSLLHTYRLNRLIPIQWLALLSLCSCLYRWCPCPPL